VKHGDARGGRPSTGRPAAGRPTERPAERSTEAPPERAGGPPTDPFVRRDAFLGFPLSTTVATGLADVMRRVDAAAGDDDGPLRWVAPPHLHVNFRHLGPMLPEHLTYLAEQLGQALATTERFPLHLGDFALWPDPADPRALWVRLVDDEGALAGLRRTLDEALAALDLTTPEHRFEPHVTLARTVGLRDPQALFEHATTARAGAVGRFWVTHVQIFAAAPAGGEAPYEPWARVALQPRAGRDASPPPAGDEGGGGGEEPAGGRVVVRYLQPLLPTPNVAGGGRPVLPGGKRLRRLQEEGSGEPEREIPEDEEPPETENGTDAGAPEGIPAAASPPAEAPSAERPPSQPAPGEAAPGETEPTNDAVRTDAGESDR